MEKWNGRVALVTGANGGMGQAVSRVLVKYGMKVVGADRAVDKIKVLAAELKNEKGSLTAIACDMTKDQEVHSMFESIKKSHGGVDLCFNGAGLAHSSSILDGTTEQWRNMMEVNVVGLCLCTQLAVKSMKERGVDDGHIINICSAAGHRVSANASLHYYTASKHAVKAITEAIRQELRQANSHIRASQISPGIVQTEFYYSMVQDKNAADKTYYNPIKCLQAEDIADTVVHIMSAPPHVEINEVIIRPTEQAF